MASSSSANNSYDVFLSFRGTDTRNNFTSHLHKALCDNYVKAFIDTRIDRGEVITSFLDKIIEGVKLSIIVFSADYASSTFCLDEMVKIMECQETKSQIVLPIFYKMYPSEEMYKETFARYEQTSKYERIVERLKSFLWRALHWITIFLTIRRYEVIISKEMKVERWKSSFRKALELAGWHVDDNRNEAQVIEEITRVVVERLNSQFEVEMKSTQMVGQTPKDYLGKIMQCLMNDENPRVGVWGMGGVGKTTIVTHINNRLLKDVAFSRRIYWVTVSKHSSIFKLQGDIAKAIKLDLSGEENESKRAAKLFNELKRINKFVLILDDVWEAFETEDVGIPLMDGQKLLLTTRYLGVCQRMMCRPIEVKPLYKHEALDLFLKESKIQINDFGEWRDIVQSIVKECAGLPLAIVVVARTMRGTMEIHKWRNTLRELQKPCKGESPEIEEKVFQVLKFSYDRLPNDRYRQCFLYCSLFPEDRRFQRDYLIEYWIGEGLIDELDSRQAELDKGNAILDELIQSSLLENNVKSYKPIKMHDVIRDMARIIVKDGLHFQDPFESVQVLNRSNINVFSTFASHRSKLRTLVLINDNIMGFSDCLFFNMQNLNVLHMAHVESVSKSITNLRNLRVLIIFDAKSVMRIPSLVGLEKLQHLNISGNDYLMEMPKGIEKLGNLKVLDLSMNRILIDSFPSGVLEKLSHLQTLNLHGSTVIVEPDALISLEKLEIMRVAFYNIHELNCYLKSRHSQRLLDYQIDYRMWNPEKRKKGMCLQVVRYVDVCKGEFGIFLPENIQNLKLGNWEIPISRVLKNRTFVDLQTVHIEEYEGRYLFTIDFAQQFLHCVRELCIKTCKDLEEIIAREDKWVDRSNNINYPTIVLSNLKKLSFDYLPRLKSIYRGRMVCPSLELFRIHECDEVEKLPIYMEEEGNKQHPTIKLQGKRKYYYDWDGLASRRSWNSLKWDDPNAKSMYHSILSGESESEYEGESESE